MKCLVAFPTQAGRVERQWFENPRETIVAWSIGAVVPALEAVERAQRAGAYLVGYVAYDAAPAFDAALKVRASDELPLLCFGVFDAPAKMEAAPQSGVEVSPWQLNVERSEFIEQVESLRAQIRDGVAYQVNYTLRAHAEISGDMLAYFDQLRRAQACDYCAYIELGAHRVLSASPELFFQVREGVITTRPMKGTASRGRWPDEDARIKDRLSRSEKERAENLMIVDLLRNDLSRISEPFGVRVASLFEVERYPTVFQMTSTVEAKLRKSVGLAEIFRALFPCGSVTGAPKVKAMELIHDAEPTPRGIYCGSIGVLSPHHAVFNVAIRTVVVNVDTQQAVCGLGSGITFDSRAELEFEEVRVKSRFLDEAPQPFELLETLLFDGKDFWLRDRHLERLSRSAGHFGFPLNLAAVNLALDHWRLNAPASRARVRLLVGGDGSIRIEAVEIETPAPGQDPVVVPFARQPVSQANKFLYHKTTRRDEYERQMQDFPDAFDVLLWNDKGEVTEFTRGNVVVEIDGKRCTPPLECGLLGGTFREELLNRGEIEERVLSRVDVLAARKIWFVNSVRGWVEVMLDSYDRLGSSVTLGNGGKG